MASDAADAGRLELLFLGSGTSAGVPMIGCECETCTSTDPRDSRTRCSVVISYPTNPPPPERPAPDPAEPRLPWQVVETPEEARQTRVLVDTTPELRIQAVANRLRRIDALVFTHAHADHIMGLDDVRRFNTVRRGPLDVWADEATLGTINRTFAYAFHEPDPGAGVYRPHLIPRLIKAPFDIGGRTWTPIPLVHGGMPVLGFRVGDLAYCTDVSEIPPASWELLEGLDVLVLDALQHRKHPTHFNIAEAIEVVARLRPRRTFFTHISHGVLHARDEPGLPEGIRFAHDGLRVVSGE